LPKAVIGRLGDGGSGSNEGGGCGQSGSNKRSTNAVVAHESKSLDVCDDAAYFGTLCSEFAAPRQRKSSQYIKYLIAKLVPHRER
jgi:hypothetical protein